MPTPYQQHLLDQIEQSPVFGRASALKFEPGSYARFVHLSGSARALVIARLQQKLGRPILVITADSESAEVWYDDLEQFGVPGRLHFPITETLPYENEEPIIEIVSRQYSALYYLARGERSTRTTQPPEADQALSAPPPLMVVPVEALQRKVPSREAFDSLFLNLWWGETVDQTDVARRLVAMGYDRQAMAETRGEFSIRGHIVDIFPPHLDYPVRLDLFGDEIESIRFYDPATQRSLRSGQELERVTILPVSVESLAYHLAMDDELQPSENPRLTPLMDWLPENAIILLDTPEKYDSILEQFDKIALRRYEELTGKTPLPETPEFREPSDWERTEVRRALPLERYFMRSREVQSALGNFAQIIFPQIVTGETESPADFDFGVQDYDTIPPDLDAYISLMRSRQGQDFSIHVVCDNEGQVTRLKEQLNEHDLDSMSYIPGKPETDFHRRHLLEGYQAIILTTGPMHTGFIFAEARLLMVTDREMFGRYKRRRAYRRAHKGRTISSPGEIRRGDYVIHTDHGVGEYLGIRRQTIDGRNTELLELEYAEGNKLLVPIENVGRIQKFSSPEGATPTLDRLGGQRWSNRKRKSQEKIEQMAQELLEIYARRETARGHAYGPDTIWQREFEESFIYDETRDQLRAIDEIKDDMVQPRPMDRLLCGDVGFGKTEVAMRAAFKAVQEKKQVAILVPTTILAQQHFVTFKERFADYPVKIEVISRFRTDTEQREVIKNLKTGDVHVVIGTHRLLSTDVAFLDLGLLIVDEEHRFGVKQKEKIKSLRASVDILTLSATPIPRTLHFALSGLRDMSTINTPPRDRLPVRTRVIHFDKHELEEAVMRELNRGGQIYFVHNRVQTIHRAAKRLTEIVPQARIAIGHGQMHERELEKVMFDFINRKYDILLATTIIESGLDIPNVNTIIINRADAFGLAQLYQLRGRVGRDVKRAYAYLIVPDGRPITDTAVKRLRAIEEFTELGMGFQVAMRDLEIRGTGNILGPEQHGAIDAVGFELYCTMLEEAVQRMRGTGSVLDEPVEIKWNLSALLPAEYVPVEPQRLEFYKRCSTARSPGDIEEMKAELRDRYGEIPDEAENLMTLSLMRVLARQCGIRAVTAGRKGFRLTPRGDVFDFLRRALTLQDKSKRIKAISADVDGSILFQLNNWDPDKHAPFALKVLNRLSPARLQ